MEANQPNSLTYKLTALRDSLAQRITTKFELQTYTTITIVRQIDE